MVSRGRVIHKKGVCWGTEEGRIPSSSTQNGLGIVYKDLKRSEIRNLLYLLVQQLKQPVELWFGRRIRPSIVRLSSYRVGKALEYKETRRPLHHLDHSGLLVRKHRKHLQGSQHHSEMDCSGTSFHHVFHLEKPTFEGKCECHI